MEAHDDAGMAKSCEGVSKMVQNDPMEVCDDEGMGSQENTLDARRNAREGDTEVFLNSFGAREQCMASFGTKSLIGEKVATCKHSGMVECENGALVKTDHPIGAALKVALSPLGLAVAYPDTVVVHGPTACRRKGLPRVSLALLQRAISQVAAVAVPCATYQGTPAFCWQGVDWHCQPEHKKYPWSDQEQQQNGMQQQFQGQGTGRWWRRPARSLHCGVVERLNTAESGVSLDDWVLSCLLVRHGPSEDEDDLSKISLKERAVCLRALAEALKKIIQEMHQELERVSSEQRVLRECQLRACGREPSRNYVSFGMGLVNGTTVEWETSSADWGLELDDAMTGNLTGSEFLSLCSTGSDSAQGFIGPSQDQCSELDSRGDFSFTSSCGSQKVQSPMWVRSVVIEPTNDVDTIQVVYCGDVVCTLHDGKAVYAPLTGDCRFDEFIDRIIATVSEFYFTCYY